MFKLFLKWLYRKLIKDDYRRYDKNGNLKYLVVTWEDSIWYEEPKMARELYGWRGPAMGWLLMGSAAVYFTSSPLWLAPCAVATVITLGARMVLDRYEEPDKFRRKLFVYIDGRIKFASKSPEGGRLWRRQRRIRIEDIHSIEYAPTSQWTALDPAVHKLKFAGCSYDVYAMLNDRSRWLIARNVWDRSYNHQLMVVLLRTLEEVREAQRKRKPPPGPSSSASYARVRATVN